MRLCFFFYSEWFNLGRTTSRLCVLFASTAYTSIAFSNSTSNTLINHSCKMKTKGKITGIGPLKRRRFHFYQVSCRVYLKMIALFIYIYISYAAYQLACFCVYLNSIYCRRVASIYLFLYKYTYLFLKKRYLTVASL